MRSRRILSDFVFFRIVSESYCRVVLQQEQGRVSLQENNIAFRPRLQYRGSAGDVGDISGKNSGFCVVPGD